MFTSTNRPAKKRSIERSFAEYLLLTAKYCCPYRAEPRTFDAILENLTTLNTQGLLPDLSSFGGVRDNDSEEEDAIKE